MLSTKDLEAIEAGDMARVSDHGLRMLAGDTGTKRKPDSAMSRFATGAADPIHGGAQSLTHVLPEGVVRAGNQFNNWLADRTGLVAKLPEGGMDQLIKDREAAYSPPEGFDWARLAGNAATNVAMGATLGGVAPASMAGRVATGAGIGGATAALTPVAGGQDFASEKLKQVGAGAAFGAAAPVVAAGVGRIVSPKASVNPDVALLRREGVRPTIGQLLGGRFNALEEKAASLPIAGDAISSARKRALEDFNRAAIKRAVGPVGGSVDDVGQAGVAKAGDLLSDAYESAKSAIKVVRFDNKFAKDFSQLHQMSNSLTPPMKRQFDKVAKETFGGRLSPAGSMLGDTFKKVDSELGQRASRFSSSAVASEQELGDALKQFQALLRDQAMRGNPAAATAMRKADQGWANLVRVEGAAKAAKNSDGLFTPAQLNTAIQTADRSVRKRAVARGESLMQDLGTAGQNVIGNKVPNSFTTDRALIAAGGLGSGYLNPSIPIGLVGGAAAYSPLGQWLLRGAIASRPELAQPVARLLNQTSPMLAPGAGLLGLQLVDK